VSVKPPSREAEAWGATREAAGEVVAPLKSGGPRRGGPLASALQAAIDPARDHTLPVKERMDAAKIDRCCSTNRPD
jgi:hypothetical protein